jgi:hypothetical protein
MRSSAQDTGRGLMGQIDLLSSSWAGMLPEGARKIETSRRRAVFVLLISGHPIVRIRSLNVDELTVRTLKIAGQSISHRPEKDYIPENGISQD